MEDREQCLMEHPAAVLKVYAQECGIHVHDALEKRDLVRLIMQAEPQNLSYSGVRADRPHQQAAHSQADILVADERLARSLQAEEDRAERRFPGPSSGEGAFDIRELQAELQGYVAALSEFQTLFARVPNGPAAGTASSQRLPSYARVPGQPSRPAALGVPPAGNALDERSARGGLPASLPSGLAALLASHGVAQAAQSSTNGAVRSQLAHAPPSIQVGHSPFATLMGGAQTANETDALFEASFGSGEHSGLLQLAALLGELAPDQGIDDVAIDRGTTTTTLPPQDASSQDASAENRQCMVCLEEFRGGEEVRILPCLHRYHKNCVDQWLTQNRHCPICKHDVTAS